MKRREGKYRVPVREMGAEVGTENTKIVSWFFICVGFIYVGGELVSAPEEW